MKQIKKLSLSNVIGKLTRNEMRYVMAGSGAVTPECTEECNSCKFCSSNSSCPKCTAGKCSA